MFILHNKIKMIPIRTALSIISISFELDSVKCYLLPINSIFIQTVSQWAQLMFSITAISCETVQNVNIKASSANRSISLTVYSSQPMAKQFCEKHTKKNRQLLTANSLTEASHQNKRSQAC